MSKKTLVDVPDDVIAGHRILVRVDFNVPLDDAGQMLNDTRMRKVLPTLRYLRERGGRLILLSHLGRPGGRPDPVLSLGNLADSLGQLLDGEVSFTPRLVDESALEAVETLQEGNVLLLENTRFHPGETKNSPELSRRLADMADLFVNDAFGVAHRAHASTVGVARSMRANGRDAVAGMLMERELRFLRDHISDPERPYMVILGGSKISGKIDVIHTLLPKVDLLLVGGAMANTFLRAVGLETGKSLVEEGRVEIAETTLRAAGDKIILPADCVVAEELARGATTRIVERTQVGVDDRIGDIGVRTREIFADALAHARTVVWNGPMGMFEIPPFSAGTLSVAHSVADVTERGGMTIVGGGDSASAAHVADVAERMTHISTGGGASLELLAGRRLPGVEALSDREEI